MCHESHSLVPKITSVLQLLMPMITNGTKWYNALLYQQRQTDVLAPAHQMMVVAYPFLQSLLYFSEKKSTLENFLLF